MDPEVKTSQINAILGALGAIRHRLDLLVAASGPKPSLIVDTGVQAKDYFVDAALPGIPFPATPAADAFVESLAASAGRSVESLKGSELAAAQRRALMAVLDALTGWVEAAYEDHRTRGHNSESVGAECWRQFAPSDIRRMVNDACKEVGLKPFPEPRNPVEDSPGE
jgi:hypothetical protein